MVKPKGELHKGGGDGKPEKRAPFQSGYLCSGICKRQLEFAYVEKV